MNLRARFPALIVLLAMLLPGEGAKAQKAQAQQDVLTLACKGTVSSGDEKPKPDSRGLIVNLTTRTMEGLNDLSYFHEPPTEITGVNNATIQFFSQHETEDGILVTLLGSIDRVTGDLEATWTVSGKKLPKSSGKYLLNCSPAQRRF